MQSADASAPGADDNGSGSAGLLELARVLKNHKGFHDLRFVLFGGESRVFLEARCTSRPCRRRRGKGSGRL